MKIQKIHIQNYKSLVDFKLEDVKPFTAFVGPNASGKSNIFEALEFGKLFLDFNYSTPNLFGGVESILTYNESTSVNSNLITFIYQFYPDLIFNYRLTISNNEIELLEFWEGTDDQNETISVDFFDINNVSKRKEFINKRQSKHRVYDNEFEQFFDNFSRIFVSKTEFDRIPIYIKLVSSGKNLPQIIVRIFEDKDKREDFIEWLRILVPEFKDIVVEKNSFDNTFSFKVIEKSNNKAFPVHLLSDGTKNILTLMAAVYQQEQQFLCIEEPENGLHPQAIELLVDFFREKCEGENGHHIWLNTHSPTLIRCLEIDEVITVNKIDGRTIAKQNNKSENINIKTDEAWLSNALGGGVSWSK